MKPTARATPRLRPPGARARRLAAALTVFGLLLAAHGGPAGAATTDVITVTPERDRQDGNSGSPSISGDGRYVAFSSVATNLVPDDTNGTSDVFVRDRSAGVTRRASVASNGAQSDGDARDPVISRDGRYVAFVSNAAKLVPGDGPRSFQVYLHDLATRQTSLVSVGADGARASGDCRPGFAAPALSADGGWIAFGCDATNLVDDGKGAGMFLRDCLAGLTVRASVDADGLPVTDATAAFPALSAGGRVLAFQTQTALAQDDSLGYTDVYVYDRDTRRTQRASLSSGAVQGNFHSGSSAGAFGPGPAVSPDGRSVAFGSAANNLVPDDTNDKDDLFLRDLELGVTTRFSLATDGTQGDDDSPGQQGGKPAFSADGRFVAFTSYATTLTGAARTQRSANVYLRDLKLNQTSLLSLTEAGDPPNGSAFAPAITADGRQVAYVAFGTNIDPTIVEYHAVVVRDFTAESPTVAGPTLTAPVGPVGANLGVAGGATVEGGTTVHFPPKALAGVTNVTVTAARTTVPGVTVSGGQLLPFTIDVTKDPPFPLGRPVEIQVRLAAADLGVRGLRSVQGGVVNGNTVDPLPTRIINADANIVGISVDHFTKFTLFQVTKPGPQLVAPADNALLSGFGTPLAWKNGPGITQTHLQLVPFNGDGPGVNLIRDASEGFVIPAPPDWYGLLPDMTYTWRVRTATLATPATENDWSAWTTGRFRTPSAGSGGIGAADPRNGGAVSGLTPVLQWSDTQRGVFYYEVQVSRDRTFVTDPALATAMVYGALIHGGVASPPNSYAIPRDFPLEAATTYYWRVRPRIQGDGTPVAWSDGWSFRTE